MYHPTNICLVMRPTSLHSFATTPLSPPCVALSKGDSSCDMTCRCAGHRLNDGNVRAEPTRMPTFLPRSPLALLSHPSPFLPPSYSLSLSLSLSQFTHVCELCRCDRSNTCRVDRIKCLCRVLCLLYPILPLRSVDPIPLPTLCKKGRRNEGGGVQILGRTMVLALHSEAQGEASSSATPSA